MLTFPTKKKINTFLIFIVPAHVQNNKSNTFWKLQLHVPHLKWDSLNDSEKQIASSQVLPTIYLQCCVFIIKESPDVYARQRMRDGEKRKRWGNRERVCIACGGHYFRRAPRLGELENIILSGWFDSAMKNVRSGDDKSWCWGEGTGRQGMSFVMSAIWLQPLRLPSSLPSAFSSTSHPFSRTPPPLHPSHLNILLPPSWSACLPLPFSFHCNDLFEHILPSHLSSASLLVRPRSGRLSSKLSQFSTYLHWQWCSLPNFVKNVTRFCVNAQEERNQIYLCFVFSSSSPHHPWLAPPTSSSLPTTSSFSCSYPQQSLFEVNGKD